MAFKTRSTRTPFEILGVSVSDDHATIKAAWKRLVRQNHPDRCPADAARLTARLAELNAAYDKLKNHTPFRPGAARKPQQPDFAAEAAARAEARARAEAKAQAEAAARKAAAERAAAEQAARARRAARAEAARRAAEQAARKARPLSATERATLDRANRAFASARAAMDGSAAPAFARAA